MNPPVAANAHFVALSLPTVVVVCLFRRKPGASRTIGITAVLGLR